MQYRVEFRFQYTRGYYFTEWFDTFEEAKKFITEAEDYSAGMMIVRIEDSNHETV